MVMMLKERLGPVTDRDEEIANKNPSTAASSPNIVDRLGYLNYELRGIAAILDGINRRLQL